MSGPDTPYFAPAPTPGAPFVAPLILRAASRPRALVLRDLLLTLMLWGGWLYLLVAVVGVFWIPPFVQDLLPVERPDSPWPAIVMILTCAIIAIGGITLVGGRAMHDRRRFRGADRRRTAGEPSDAAFAAALQADGLDLPSLRAARRIVMHHAPDGSLLRADTSTDAPAR